MLVLLKIKALREKKHCLVKIVRQIGSDDQSNEKKCRKKNIKRNGNNNNNNNNNTNE